MSKIFIILFSITFFTSSFVCCSEQEKKNIEKYEIEQNVKTITFLSEDGLIISADTYIKHKLNAPLILLFHQAGWSRGEYIEIAPKLNDLGFNCIAVDQRSGEKVNDIINKTHSRATTANKPTAYLDAYVDMVATLSFAKDNYSKGEVLVWGSSYSAALVLKLASEQKGKIDGVLSFSPGEYFVRFGKTETFISDFAKNITVPIFITSAKNEKPNWENIFNSVSSENKHYFLPKTNGNHGSRALWSKFEDCNDYWNAVIPFLKKYFLN
ncbi:MAG: alpha/beta hydrolase [Ignavibacteriae bacterium]|nr:alpha/beta hydrolase [Ignavibacteriota bacterium]